METRAKKIVLGITIVVLGFITYWYLFRSAPKYDETQPQQLIGRPAPTTQEPNRSTHPSSPTAPAKQESVSPTTPAKQESVSPTTPATQASVSPAKQESVSPTAGPAKQESVSPTAPAKHESVHANTSTTAAVANSGATVSVGAESTFPKVGLIGTDPKSHCCSGSSAGVSLEVLCGKTSDDNEECTCVDYMYCRLVVVTAISSNHFKESQDMVASVQKFLPSTKLILYDLGLTANERKMVSAYCNVELRTFPFELYPPHFKKLSQCAWKPIMHRDVSEEYEVVLVADASVRLIKGMKDTVLPHLQKFPFVAGPVAKLPIIAMVHDGMLKYLNVSREEAKVLIHTIQGGIHTTWATKQIKEKLIKYWADCAMHPECIAPPGSSLFGCNFKMVEANPGKYAGCHRYDQSALNVIIYREFGAEVWRNVQNDQLARSVFTVERHPTSYYKIKYCT